MGAPDSPYLVERMQGFGTTIFAEMSSLAVATGAINLGQGFPDEDGPPEVLDAAIAAIREGHNQYPPGIGIPELRHAIAAHQAKWYSLEYDPDTEVLVTAGATEAIAASLLALCEPGTDVVTFEPYYDEYAAGIALAGAHRRVVQLRTPDWSFDAHALERAITPATRVLLLNSPHNPTGKVFSVEELELIARLCVEHDLLAITDEVYEHLVFDGRHVPLATMPGMRERTITISSAGKTFSCTGWKIGWICAPPELLDAVKTVKQFLTYVNGAPFQYAIATGLDLPGSVFRRAAAVLEEKRDRLRAGLAEAGLTVFRSDATYFVTVDISPLGERDGLAFCRSLPERCGVVAVPSVVFYDDKEAGGPLVRFACCKRLDVIDEAAARLGRLRA
jgi:N-succinyldiaminopimelate aminotransferase